MRKEKIWDPVVRVFHWALAAGILANGLFVDDESQLHITLGYGVVMLVLLRILWGFTGSKHARFSDFPPSIEQAMAQLSHMATGRGRIYRGHTPLGALMMYNMLVTVLLIGASGYMMTTAMFRSSGWVEEAHETFVIWMGFSILVHVGAAILESRRSGVNLPLAMVTGTKTFPGHEVDKY
ncbi:cytochrome b/b6 domain-containing protein [Thalassovita taeanensis]|uniref:Cytochrome b n=1 Tax=Thalassovita taeanensis TaxID=657014 RepID=A0A1H8ZJM1_9RHOB|nr:cytochrome b/b6 domain-containing protein [Thalassovita taeanensis]SEP64515.1 Cytochrome b [Thalassovita taeanensis]